MSCSYSFFVFHLIADLKRSDHERNASPTSQYVSSTPMLSEMQSPNHLRVKTHTSQVKGLVLQSVSGASRLVQRLWEIIIVATTPLPDRVSLTQSKSKLSCNEMALGIEVLHSRRLSHGLPSIFQLDRSTPGIQCVSQIYCGTHPIAAEQTEPGRCSGTAA